MKAIFHTLALLLVCCPAMADESPRIRSIILDNGNMVSGEVTKTEEGWQIKLSASGVTIIPFKSVVAVVENRQKAFEFMADKANLRDADERIRLANWCVKHEMMDEAIRQAEIAVRMRDNFKAANQLLASLQLMKSNKSTSEETTPTVFQAKAETAVKTEKVSDIPAIDYNSDSFPLFSTKIHAILLNVCASCHAQENAQSFKLQRQSSRQAISKNMMSALTQINPKDPAKSPILVKALIPHGSAIEAPFKSKNHPAYIALENWVKIARSSDGEPSMAPTPKLDFAEPRKLPDLNLSNSSKPELSDSKPSIGFGSTRPAPSTSPEKAPVVDPFDPEEFNKAKPKKE